MSKYEVTDIPDFTEGQTKRLDELQAAADGKLTLEDREELLKLQWLEAAAYNKEQGDTAKAVACYERFKRLDK